MFGISLGVSAQKGEISWPSAAPKGLERDATAVAVVRPAGLNQRLEYVVGAESTKGCAKPMRSWPSITTPNVFERVPPYLTQLPTRRRQAAIVMEILGPCLWSAQNVNGVAATNAKRKAVESQLMMLSVVLKYVATVSETGAKAIQSQETTMLRRIS